MTVKISELALMTFQRQELWIQGCSVDEITQRFLDWAEAGLLVAYWLKQIERSRVPVPLAAEIYVFLFWVHSDLPQKLSRFSFASFGGDIRLSVLNVLCLRSHVPAKCTVRHMCTFPRIF